MSNPNSAFNPLETVGLGDRDKSQSAISRQRINEIVDELKSYGMTGDQYQIEAELGKGGMATVYKVMHLGLMRTSVLKVALPIVMSEPDLLARFVEEARITSQLVHPNIIAINDIGVLDGKQVFYSMNYIESEALDTILKKVESGDADYEARYNIFSLLAIFRKICDACAYAHSKGIIHRDIKPANIMIGKYGEVLLADWGLAIREHSHKESTEAEAVDPLARSATIIKILDTRDQFIRATPAYMSPEQAWGETSTIDRRTDIFLLGATLYSLATLRTLYTGGNIRIVLADAKNCNFIPPAERAPERQIPEDLCKVIARATKHSRDDRYQTVEELCVDIDALMTGHTLSAKKVFRTGQYLIREGEVGKEAFVIRKGQVEVFKMIDGVRVHLRNIAVGDCVGELSVIAPAPRSASVMATEDTEVIIIDQNVIRQSVNKMPPWMGRVIQSLVEHLRDATSNIHYLISEDCSYHVLAQVRLLYPLMSEPVVEQVGNSTMFAVRTNELIAEIMQNLSIPLERVSSVIIPLFETALVRQYGDDQVIIPDFPLFYKFVDFVAQKRRIDTAIRSSRTPLILSDNSKITLSLPTKTASTSGADSEAVEPDSGSNLAATEWSEELVANFETLYTKIVEKSVPPPPGAAE